MDGRTPRTAAMDAFRWGSGGGMGRGNVVMRMGTQHQQQVYSILIGVCAALHTKMIVQAQLVEPTVCFSDIKACEELIHLFRQKPNNIVCRQQTLFLIFMNQTLYFMIFTLANDHLFKYDPELQLNSTNVSNEQLC